MATIGRIESVLRGLLHGRDDLRASTAKDTAYALHAIAHGDRDALDHIRIVRRRDDDTRANDNDRDAGLDGAIAAVLADWPE